MQTTHARILIQSQMGTTLSTLEQKIQARKIVRKHPVLPQKAKLYLKRLIAKGKLPQFILNTYLRTIPQIVIEGDIARRISLDEFLAKRPEAYKGERVTNEELAGFPKAPAHHTLDGSSLDASKILAAAEERRNKGLTNTGVNLIYHYYVGLDILDRAMKMEVRK